MPSPVQNWRATLGLFGLSLAALIALAIVEAGVSPPGGGCFGQPTWATWVSYSLVFLSVLAAAGSAAASSLHFRGSIPMRAAFAFSITVFWLVVVVLTLVAVEGSC